MQKFKQIIIAIGGCSALFAVAHDIAPSKLAKTAAKQEPQIVADQNQADDALVYFDFDSAKLNAKGKEKLNKFAQALRENHNQVYEIYAGTDPIGKYKYNFELAKQRAASVYNYLVAQKGVSTYQAKIVEFNTNRNAHNETPFPLMRVTEVKLQQADVANTCPVHHLYDGVYVDGGLGYGILKNLNSSLAVNVNVGYQVNDKFDMNLMYANLSNKFNNVNTTTNYLGLVGKFHQELAKKLSVYEKVGLALGTFTFNGTNEKETAFYLDNNWISSYNLVAGVGLNYQFNQHLSMNLEDMTYTPLHSWSANQGFANSVVAGVQYNF